MLNGQSLSNFVWMRKWGGGREGFKVPSGTDGMLREYM